MTIKKLLLWVSVSISGLIIALIATDFAIETYVSYNVRNPNRLILISRIGASGFVVSGLSANNDAWEEMLRAVRVGQKDWLNLANELVGTGYAHANEELYGALSTALDHFPEAVLRLQRVVPEIVCSIVDEHHYEGSNIDLKTIYRNRVARLSGVKDPLLGQKVAECLRGANQLLPSNKALYRIDEKTGSR
jgi:hypothetical protein